MPLDPLTLLVGLAGTLLGSGGVYALLKVGPERRKTDAEVHTSLLRDSHTAYQQLSEELAHAKMINISLEKENEDCRDKVVQLQRTLRMIEEEINRHGRMSELARRKAHIAINALGGYELHIEHLLDRLRDEKIQLTPLDRPTRLRQAFQAEMNKLEELESIATAQAITSLETSSE